MKARALSTAAILPLMLCQCHTVTPAEEEAPGIDDPATPPKNTAQQFVEDYMAMLNTEKTFVTLTPEESEDLNNILSPLCTAQDDICVYYHGIQYKGDKPQSYLLGTLKADDFKLLAASTQSVALGEVADDFERYTFCPLKGEKVEAYISQSNREYGIELTGAPAVYAPEFHDRILAMRHKLILPPPPETPTAENTQP